MGKRLEQALAEADEIEAAEATADPDAPIPAHVKVSRPGRARSKVLQVRLTPEELAALEAIAERRELPVSTVARDQLLGLIDRETALLKGGTAAAALIALMGAAERFRSLQPDALIQLGAQIDEQLSSRATIRTGG